MTLQLVHDAKPPGHAWVKGPDYREPTPIGKGPYLDRSNTIRCTTCGVVAYWCEGDRAYYVDNTPHTYRAVMPSCQEERVKQAGDAEYRAAIAEGEEEWLP